MPIQNEPFGTTPEGAQIERYTLTNLSGTEADIITLGGIVTALRVPDRTGALGDIVLGFDSLQPYLDGHPYFGSLVGRYGNRIARGRFELDGQSYTLACNNGPNHLHGGPGGFHTRVWQAQASDAAGGPSLQLRYRSADGEEGYPGALDVTVVYTLTDANELRIDYTAQTDRATIVNLTNHSYFNLAGSGDILEHTVEIPAERFIPIDATFIPTGELRPVQGTPMDFRAATPIGARIGDSDEQIQAGLGYDHTWVLDKPASQLGRAATVYEPTTGRMMEVETTEPGVQFYSGNFLDGALTGKGGWVYEKRSALCLETQHFPDSPNQPQFPSTVLRPGETYRTTTLYRFSTR